MSQNYYTIILLLIVYLFNKKSIKEKFKPIQELSAVEDNLIIREYPRPSFIQDDHPESRENNLNKARFRFAQIN